jgi:alpha-mannosidase
MRINQVSSTDLFTGSAARPYQVVRVTVVNDGADMIHDRAAVLELSLSGAGVSTPEPEPVTDLLPGEERTVEVGVQIAAPATPGVTRPVTAVLQGHPGRWEAPGQITVAETGWTMWMVSHFHYDPVWWNTQGRFAETWPLLPPEDGRDPEVSTAFELCRLHLEEARKDPDYKFVLAEIDYLKPFFDAYPQERADLLAFIAAGRIEIVGGSYNEPNTNLTCAESTIRNAVYGLAYQRDVLGADPAASWMLDAFGFDPAYPGLMSAAGLTESSWARGPFHQWGPDSSGDGNEKMQFPSEFEWLSPDGQGLLTSYMPNHYSAGWITQHAPDLATAERDAYNQFRQLAPVAATRNVLLPVGGDHVVPSKWATAIHRDWNARYQWPRFVTAVPRDFFAAVRSEAAASGTWLMPQTRDMNPLYPGKDVSYIDTKQAQRDAEIALLDGERLATAAWLAGAPYPAASLDKGWRLLAFGAHHDAITGTEGDQVYLDLLAGWREAFERGDQARADAMAHLAGLADTQAAVAGAAARTAAASGPAGRAAAGLTRPVVVFNTLSWPRSGLARVTLELSTGEAENIAVTDEAGTSVPALAEGITRHPDGSLASLTLTFAAADVPPVGYRTYLAVAAEPAEQAAAARPASASGWSDTDGWVIENDTFTVTADPAGGGVLRSVIDRRSGTELLAGPGNELMLQDEYPTHPRWGEGPWLLCPKGPWHGSARLAARVRAQRCPLGSRLLAEFSMGDLRVEQETLLWDGSDLVQFRTHVDGSIGQDRLLRVRFAADVPGGLPVFQTGLSVIGRPLGQAQIDVAEHTFTLDNPAHEWFGMGSTARVALAAPGGERSEHAIGVAELVAPAGPVAGGFAPRDPAAGLAARDELRNLVIALARQGVTATCSVPDGPRYGAIEVDSNLPDVRITVGGPAANSFTAAVLEQAGAAVAAELDRQLAENGSARIWVPAKSSRSEIFGPSADLRGVTSLPVLIVAADDLQAAIDALAEDLDDARIDVPWPGDADGQDTDPQADPDLAGHSVALLNRGLPGSLVTPDGDVCISLMRACSSWPSGIWLDGDKRTVPDGSSFAWQHWSHTFEYALAAGAGDWRAAGFPAAGQDYSHQLLACQAQAHQGPLPASASLASVTGAGTALMALKPRGNPLAPLGQPDPADGVTIRLRDLGGPASEPALAADPPGNDAPDVTGSAGGVIATVRLLGGIAAARVTDVLEQASGEPVSCEAGAATVLVPARGTITLDARPAGTRGVPAVTGVAPEPAQPVFTRYWLHGKGPAPAGNLPVAVHLTPSLTGVEPGQSAAVRLTVGCGLDPASGTITLDVPDGLELTSVLQETGDPAVLPRSGGGPPELDYHLPPRGYAAWNLTVRAPADAAAGRHFLAARILDGAGQVLEDAAVISVGEFRQAPRGLPLAEIVDVLEAAQQAEAAEAELTQVTGHLTVRPGGHGKVSVTLANNTASELRGEATLISSHGSWRALTPWTTGFAAPAGGSIPLTFDVAVPADARPGQRWWALVKVMYFGRLRYSEPVWIDVND